jgi:hypothetical protein
MSANALRDQNRVPVALGQSNTDSTVVLPFLIDSVTGRLLVSGTGGSATIYTETPTGAIDGVNKVYTTAQTITTVIGMWYNGEFIHPAEYTPSGAGFTMGTALPVISGAAFTISYV